MKLTQAQLLAALNALIDTGGPFDPAEVKVGLASAIEDMGLNTTMANVTPSTGAAGVTEEITTWGAPYITGGSLAVVDSPLLSWFPASGDQETSAAFYYLTDSATTPNLLAYDSLSQNYNLYSTTTPVHLVVRLTMDVSGTWSVSIDFA